MPMPGASETCVYLIHIEPPVHHAQHYVGMCITAQFERRMRDHGTGNGAALLREAVKRGSSLYVVRRWENAGRAEEKSIKAARHYKLRCPMCSEHQARKGPFTIIKLQTRPFDPTTFKDLTWSSACGPMLI